MFELAHEALRAARLEHLQLLLKVYDEAFPRLTCDETRLKTLMPGERTRRVCQQLFDGTRPLRHTLTASVLGRPKTVRLVLYLQAAEAIEFAVLPVDQQNAAALAQERLRVLKMQDCYQRLCLPYVAHAETIDAVYQRRRDEVAPRSRLHQADAASSSEAQTLLQEAASMLGTPASRRRYREKHLKPDALTFLAAVVREEAELASLHGDSSRARKLQQTVEELV